MFLQQHLPSLVHHWHQGPLLHHFPQPSLLLLLLVALPTIFSLSVNYSLPLTSVISQHLLFLPLHFLPKLLLVHPLPKHRFFFQVRVLNLLPLSLWAPRLCREWAGSPNTRGVIGHQHSLSSHIGIPYPSGQSAEPHVFLRGCLNWESADMVHRPAVSPSTPFPTPWTSTWAASCKDHYCPLRTRAQAAVGVMVFQVPRCPVSVPGTQGAEYGIQGVGQSGCPGGPNSKGFTYSGWLFLQLLYTFSVIQASCKLIVLRIRVHFTNTHNHNYFGIVGMKNLIEFEILLYYHKMSILLVCRWRKVLLDYSNII